MLCSLRGNTESQDFELHEVALVACRHALQNILNAQKSLDFCTSVFLGFFDRSSDYGTTCDQLLKSNVFSIHLEYNLLITLIYCSSTVNAGMSSVI